MPMLPASSMSAFVGELPAITVSFGANTVIEELDPSRSPFFSFSPSLNIVLPSFDTACLNQSGNLEYGNFSFCSKICSAFNLSSQTKSINEFFLNITDFKLHNCFVVV